MDEINDELSACLLEPVIQKLASTGELDSFVEKIKSRKADPYTVAEEIAKNYFISRIKMNAAKARKF